MPRGSFSLIFRAVLIFQLLLGAQWPLALAAAPLDGGIGMQSSGPCPAHAQAGIESSAPTQHSPAHHDCCQQDACLCHGAFAAPSPDLIGYRIGPSRPQSPVFHRTTQYNRAGVDEFFRPPIS